MVNSIGRSLRVAVAGGAALLTLGVATGAFAQSPDSAAVRNGVQTAIDHTDPQAAGLADAPARTAYRTAMRGAIATSGARPTVVQSGLSGVVCRSADLKARNACNAELASLLQQVVQLAEADIKNGDVASLRSALVSAVATLTAPPGTTGDGTGGGNGTNYTTR